MSKPDFGTIIRKSEEPPAGEDYSAIRKSFEATLEILADLDSLANPAASCYETG